MHRQSDALSHLPKRLSTPPNTRTLNFETARLSTEYYGLDDRTVLNATELPKGVTP
eukprot:SAG31_NODE_40481_length_280_cov_1.138122_1_plen_55_part_10